MEAGALVNPIPNNFSLAIFLVWYPRTPQLYELVIARELIPFFFAEGISFFKI